ncbi:hypothetical protein GQX74_012955 [Glossina fuscipes]|nr:hypothetical protein GQX74_012955 [Glossina fuscipes]
MNVNEMLTNVEDLSGLHKGHHHDGHHHGTIYYNNPFSALTIMHDIDIDDYHEIQHRNYDNKHMDTVKKHFDMKKHSLAQSSNASNYVQISARGILLSSLWHACAIYFKNDGQQQSPPQQQQKQHQGLGFAAGEEESAPAYNVVPCAGAQRGTLDVKLVRLVIANDIRFYYGIRKCHTIPLNKIYDFRSDISFALKL